MEKGKQNDCNLRQYAQLFPLEQLPGNGTSQAAKMSQLVDDGWMHGWWSQDFLLLCLRFIGNWAQPTLCDRMRVVCVKVQSFIPNIRSWKSFLGGCVCGWPLLEDLESYRCGFFAYRQTDRLIPIVCATFLKCSKSHTLHPISLGE